MHLYVQTSVATVLMLMVCPFELQGFNLHLNVQTSAALLTMHILNVQTAAAILLILMVRLTEEKWCPQPPKNSKAIN